MRAGRLIARIARLEHRAGVGRDRREWRIVRDDGSGQWVDDKTGEPVSEQPGYRYIVVQMPGERETEESR